MFTPTCQQPRANGTNILCVVAGLTHAAGARHTTHIAVHPSSLPPPLTPMWLYFLQMIGCLAYNQLPISAQTHINSTHSITHAQHTRLSSRGQQCVEDKQSCQSKARSISWWDNSSSPDCPAVHLPATTPHRTKQFSQGQAGQPGRRHEP